MIPQEEAIPAGRLGLAGKLCHDLGLAKGVEVRNIQGVAHDSPGFNAARNVTQSVELPQTSAQRGGWFGSGKPPGGRGCGWFAAGVHDSTSVRFRRVAALLRRCYAMPSEIEQANGGSIT